MRQFLTSPKAPITAPSNSGAVIVLVEYEFFISSALSDPPNKPRALTICANYTNPANSSAVVI